MAAVWTAHAQLSQFYLDSTPHGRREQVLHGNTKGRGPGVKVIHNKYVSGKRRTIVIMPRVWKKTAHCHILLTKLEALCVPTRRKKFVLNNYVVTMQVYGNLDCKLEHSVTQDVTYC